MTIRACAAGIESGGTEGEEDDDGPLLSWKAHKGWVAGLAFASAPTASGATGERLLLTASNDKTVSRTIIAGVWVRLPKIPARMVRTGGAVGREQGTQRRAEGCHPHRRAPQQRHLLTGKQPKNPR